MKVTTLELSDTYGPGDFRQKLISVLRRAAQTGLTLEMSEGNQNLDLVYVDDVMAAIRKAGQLQFEVTSMGEQIYQISAGKWITLKDFVERFERVSQKKVNVRWGVKPYRAREVMRPWTQGAPVPGWSPRVSLDQGIKLTLDMDLA
jgi:nucleoside-diphosphate-sugar epimerase